MKMRCNVFFVPLQLSTCCTWLALNLKNFIFELAGNSGASPVVLLRQQQAVGMISSDDDEESIATPFKKPEAEVLHFDVNKSPVLRSNAKKSRRLHCWNSPVCEKNLSVGARNVKHSTPKLDSSHENPSGEEHVSDESVVQRKANPKVSG